MVGDDSDAGRVTTYIYKARDGDDIQNRETKFGPEDDLKYIRFGDLKTIVVDIILMMEKYIGSAFSISSLSSLLCCQVFP